MIRINGNQGGSSQGSGKGLGLIGILKIVAAAIVLNWGVSFIVERIYGFLLGVDVVFF